MHPISIHAARVIAGAGRGKGLGIPTVNLDPASAPPELAHGIYACRITVSGTTYKGAMHFGPRPVFRDSVSLEVHILDSVLTDIPDTVDLAIVERIRDVSDFPSPEALLERIQRDITETRVILSRA